MDSRITVNFLGVYCLAVGLVTCAPVKESQPIPKMASPVEEELLSLSKTPDAPHLAVQPDQEAESAAKSVAESLATDQTEPVNLPPGVKVAPQPVVPGRLPISGYDQMFESPAIDLSPRAVAEYLILTGDFTGFDLALFDLIRARVLSPAEVQRYKEAVGLEYKNMLRQMLDAETSYLQAFNALYGLPSQNEAGAETLLPNPAVVEEKTVGVVAAIDDGRTLPQPLPQVAVQPGLKVEDLVQATGGRPLEMTNKEEDVELQTLLEWLDNEMRQEMESVGQPPQPPQPAEVQLPGAGGNQDQTSGTEDGDTKPDTQQPADTETLENRDSNGKMEIKDEPESESNA